MADYIVQRNGSVLRVADNFLIQPDILDADYQAFQSWISEGNIADLAAGYWQEPKKIYCPIALVRERLEARGKWGAAATVLMQYPALMLKALTLREGLDPEDVEARQMIAALQEDPDVILAPETNS